MKKLMTLAALFAAVMMSFTACNKEDDGKKPGGGGDDPEFESLITIDGDFADWDTVPAAKAVSATCATSPKHAALKTVKVYADEMFINILFEYDPTLITKTEWVPFHVYLDADNSDATGGYGDEFSDANTDILLEGGVISEGAFQSWDPAVFKWGGEVGGSGWLWGEQGVEHTEADNWGAELPEGSGVATGAGNGSKYEIQIIREMVPVAIADTFGIGFDIQDDWSSVGILPNATVADDNTEGLAAKLKVTIDK